MGPRGTYESAYRRGYQEAYANAYRRFADYNGRYYRDDDYHHDGRYYPYDSYHR
jgi:hypothetical protein